MSPIVEIEPNEPTESPACLVAVGHYPTPDLAADRGLVILAMGLPYWLAPGANEFALLVEQPEEPAVRGQLARYERECAHWPPAAAAPAPPRPSRVGLTPLLWALLTLACFWAQQRWPLWLAAGSLDAAAVFGRGEWWRPATALWLHADVGHLASNLAAGAFALAAVLATFGRRLGWTLLSAASVAGNFLSAALHSGTEYHSVGASTAIFAALGLLTGRAAASATRATGGRALRDIVVPLGAGVSMLALYGVGGLHVDVVAHACGFANGGIAGFAAFFFRTKAGTPP